MNRPVDVPAAEIPHHERMPLIRPDACHTLAKRHSAAQVEGMPALAMGFVVFKANERQRANVHLAELAVRLLDFQQRIEVGRLHRLEEVPVLIAVAGHIAGEGIEGIGPPEAGPIVLVERQDLFGQRIGRQCLTGQVAVQDVVDLGAVLHEKAVPQAAIADAVADDQVIGAVNGQPAVAAVPDGSATTELPRMLSATRW